ncbi:hypothetical protein RCN80_15830 [Escherichia coli]|nr:hypothetical protein [Escherichia coli]MED0150747.1 hypothetical protein [Escherichia coli]MED9527148.1 hypothetical protein [Escherichia coli]MED9577593.1 hypothetical protein [Escherichia coli]
MEVFWTILASQDRKRIREYIAEQNLMAAIEGVHLENGKYPTLRAFFKQPVQRSEIESLYDVYESHILGKVHENPVVVVREPHSFFRIAYIQVSSYFL